MTWRMPKQPPIAEQAAARGIPVPASGTTAADLREMGFELDDEVPAFEVLTAHAESPTGYTWRIPRGTIESLAAGRPITAKWLREQHVFKADSEAPNWWGVKELIYDEHEHLDRIDFWESPTAAELAEENERRKACGLTPLVRARVIVDVRHEFALAAPSDGAAQQQGESLDKVAKDGGLP